MSSVRTIDNYLLWQSYRKVHDIVKFYNKINFYEKNLRQKFLISSQIFNVLSSLRQGFAYSEFQIFTIIFIYFFFAHQTNLTRLGKNPTLFRLFLLTDYFDEKNSWNLWNHIVNSSRFTKIQICRLKVPKVSKLYIWHSSLDVWCLTKKRTIQSRCVLSIDKERKEGFTAFSQKDSPLRPFTIQIFFEMSSFLNCIFTQSMSKFGSTLGSKNMKSCKKTETKEMRLYHGFGRTMDTGHIKF
jgi:hypothetical protein